MCTDERACLAICVPASVLVFARKDVDMRIDTKVKRWSWMLGCGDMDMKLMRWRHKHECEEMKLKWEGWDTDMKVNRWCWRPKGGDVNIQVKRWGHQYEGEKVKLKLGRWEHRHKVRKWKHESEDQISFVTWTLFEILASLTFWYFLVWILSFSRVSRIGGSHKKSFWRVGMKKILHLTLLITVFS